MNAEFITYLASVVRDSLRDLAVGDGVAARQKLLSVERKLNRLADEIIRDRSPDFADSASREANWGRQ